MTSISPPPFRIYLLRHAHATPAAGGGRDFDRPLSDAGYSAAEIVADKAADKDYRPTLVISSTALRCRQTAQAVERAMGPELEVRYVDALYNAPGGTYIDIISAQTDADSVMLVGHNPTIEHTLEALIGQEALAAALPNGFPTGGLAVIDAASGDGSASPGWLLYDFLTA